MKWNILIIDDDQTEIIQKHDVVLSLSYYINVSKQYYRRYCIQFRKNLTIVR